ncbi:hypothetical protein FQR65_LT07190 [Abscondita terminalis]|nr:hypothetical protein FQR65_LT07190 [Abscondita terminalis]
MDSFDLNDPVNTTMNSESIETTEEISDAPETSPEKKQQPQQKKFVRVPLARIKYIMKLDPECQKISQDSVYLVAKATEYFLEYLGKESAKYSAQAKRKTVQRRDVDAAISGIPQLCFLEGALDSKV